uniref:L,D-transpeptidase family protein n=1 Tax=Pedobacter schmidteae TaxID=2201271 RepID=UPI0013CE611E|nr:L,D-transpeptidase family protein [Pedobacter schmidteae]
MAGNASVRNPELDAEIKEMKPDHRSKHRIDSVELFKRLLKDNRDVLSYPEQLQVYYQKNNYKTTLINRFLWTDDLQYLIADLEDAGSHGLDPELFLTSKLRKRSTNLNTYENEVVLELLTANALLKYSVAMQFGLLDPYSLDSNYFTTTVHADSTFLMQVLEVRTLKKYLDSIQPKSKAYFALQEALKSETPVNGKTLKETQSILAVNLERLRWKNKPAEQKYVVVNIPDFSLDVMDNGKSILHMKVCVGEAGDWETPQLNSKIYTVQVNPVWNIPESIAKNETIRNAANDRYYLSNSNIEVYRKGKLVGNVESIDWETGNLSEYSFKQLPGEQNALGKIKFLFNNKSSVYLHDTPVKSAFKRAERAISHGCIRVESPLKLAFALFGKGPKYDDIKRAMASGYPRAKYIGLPIAVPVVITYFTAFADDKGQIKFCKDVYGKDKEMMRAKM